MTRNVRHVMGGLAVTAAAVSTFVMLFEIRDWTRLHQDIAPILVVPVFLVSLFSAIAGIIAVAVGAYGIAAKRPDVCDLGDETVGHALVRTIGSCFFVVTYFAWPFAVLWCVACFAVSRESWFREWWALFALAVMVLQGWPASLLAERYGRKQQGAEVR